jgi:hypothetical protein
MNVAHLLERSARRFADRPALVGRRRRRALRKPESATGPILEKDLRC